MRIYLLSVLTLVGCATEGATTGATAPIPVTTGIYAGSYEVPTTPNLESAAMFAVDHIDWTVAGSVATLHYDLPLGLVGGKVEVTLSGQLEPGATTLTLTGAVGTGSCVATASTITCREQFTNLGALPISTAVVEQQASLGYAGPVMHRLQVANQFASDPIGIAYIDLQSPIIDDHGGGLDDH
jgi:hypothetical protein